MTNEENPEEERRAEGASFCFFLPNAGASANAVRRAVRRWHAPACPFPFPFPLSALFAAAGPGHSPR
jgi:hypothetical protein